MSARQLHALLQNPDRDKLLDLVYKYENLLLNETIVVFNSQFNEFFNEGNLANIVTFINTYLLSGRMKRRLRLFRAIASRIRIASGICHPEVIHRRDKSWHDERQCPRPSWIG